MTWRSKKQQVAATFYNKAHHLTYPSSSSEAEFRPLAHGICEGMWLKRLLVDLKVEVKGPIEVLCDN